jgi:hypothetical protein
VYTQSPLQHCTMPLPTRANVASTGRSLLPPLALNSSNSSLVLKRLASGAPYVACGGECMQDAEVYKGYPEGCLLPMHPHKPEPPPHPHKRKPIERVTD